MAATMPMKPATIAVVILLLVSTGCDAFALTKPLFNHTQGPGKHVIGDDIDNEFLMESHISRVLAEEDELRFETMRSPNPNIASVVDCERPPRFDSCLGEGKNNPPSENCDPFNRANPC
ncbi:hypothetical protein SDJN02_00343, partial [Cucurbita argyrosperma subsp. argyrosperma]